MRFRYRVVASAGQHATESVDTALGVVVAVVTVLRRVCFDKLHEERPDIGWEGTGEVIHAIVVDPP